MFSRQAARSRQRAIPLFSWLAVPWLAIVFWQVDSSSSLGTASAFVGNLIAFTSDTVTTGVSVMGRVFALGGAVTLDTNNITAAASAAGGGGDGDGDDRNGCKNDNGDRDKDHHDKGKDHPDKDH